MYVCLEYYTKFYIIHRFSYMYVSRIIFCMVLVHDYIPNFCMQVLIMYLCLGSSPIFMFPRSHGNISFPQHGKDLRKSKESCLLKAGSCTCAFSWGLGTPLGSQPWVPLPQENALVLGTSCTTKPTCGDNHGSARCNLTWFSLSSLANIISLLRFHCLLAAICYDSGGPIPSLPGLVGMGSRPLWAY